MAFNLVLWSYMPRAWPCIVNLTWLKPITIKWLSWITQLIHFNISICAHLFSANHLPMSAAEDFTVFSKVYCPYNGFDIIFDFYWWSIEIQMPMMAFNDSIMIQFHSLDKIIKFQWSITLIVNCNIDIVDLWTSLFWTTNSIISYPIHSQMPSCKQLMSLH